MYGSGGGRWTMQAGLMAAGAIVGGLIAHSVFSAREVSAGRHALLAKQHWPPILHADRGGDDRHDGRERAQRD